MKQDIKLSRRFTPFVSILLAVIVLGLTVFLARMKLGTVIRSQITNRDADVLYSAVCLLRDSSESEIENIEDPSDQLIIMLKASKLRGVIAVRLFDSNGKFVTAIPVNVKESELPETDLNVIKNLKPISHFYSALKLSELFYYVPDSSKQDWKPQPILEVNVPLHKNGDVNLAAVAQFILEGTGTAREFAILERNLTLQAVVGFGVGAVIIIFGLGYAFYKLEKRTEDLRKANQELAMAARTSAVGAVAAHLMHGLKSPIAGLQMLAVDKVGNNNGGSSDWQHAVKSIARIKAMINEVVNLLKEEQGAAVEYEISTDELKEIISNKTIQIAKEKGVNFTIEVDQDANIPNRVANLVSLILVNLVENAIQATAQSKNVKLTISVNGNTLLCSVIDEGFGLPQAMLKNPFAPCYSSKPGGSGIGLAISKQLANHLGATLQLKYSNSNGTCFELSAPLIFKKVNDIKNS